MSKSSATNSPSINTAPSCGNKQTLNQQQLLFSHNIHVNSQPSPNNINIPNNNTSIQEQLHHPTYMLMNNDIHQSTQQQHIHHTTIHSDSTITASYLNHSDSSSSLNSTSSNGVLSNNSSSHISETSDSAFTPLNANNVKSKRTNKACLACKSAHKKCSNTRPCTRCKSLGREDKCVDFESGRKRGRKANMPRSGGLLVHNYDPHNPYVSGKPNMIVFSLQHAIREEPGGILKQSKNKHKPHANKPVEFMLPPSTETDAVSIPSSSFTHQHVEPSESQQHQHATYQYTSSSATQKPLPSINELTECKNILSNSQSVFYHQ